MMQILKWVEIYLKNLPQNGGYRYKPEGGAIDLLDVYGTEGTKGAKMATKSLQKLGSQEPQPRLVKRSKAEIEATMAFCRKHYKW